MSTSTRLTKTDEAQAISASITPYSNNLNSKRPTSSLYSAKKQIAAEGEWLQDDTEHVSGTWDASHDKLSTRFNWRFRASSRIKKTEKEAGESSSYKRRVRPPNVGADKGKPFFKAIENYSEKFYSLLALEEAEDEAVLRQRLSTWSLDRLQDEGYCLTGMSAYWMQANQFGRPVASFVLGPGIILPENKFENGTQVMISRLDPLKEPPQLGSVLSRTASHIRVCFADRFDLEDGVWRLDLGRPNLVYERMRNAISYLEHDPQEIEKLSAERSSQFILQGTELRDVFLRTFDPDAPQHKHTGLQAPDDVTYPSHDTLEHEGRGEGGFMNMGAFKDDQRIYSWARRYSRTNPLVMEGDPPLGKMNTSQTKALAAMIGQRISLIQGPPGTGKTKTIIEAVKLLKVHFEVPQPILVCTYTNVAVDNLVEGLATAGVKPLRIGFHGNVRESLLHHSLDYKLEHHTLHPQLVKLVKEETLLSPQIHELEKKHLELERKLLESSKPKKSMVERARNMKASHEAMQHRHINLKKKIYAIQQQMLREVIAEADVICTTCVTAACTALNVVDFPVVFLDEASMSTEPASLIPIMKGSQHVALIGDHKQLPPVIVSQQAQADGLGMSLFERLTEEGVVPSVMLDIQYRMHPAISRFPSTEFYNFALLDGTVDMLGNITPGLDPPRSKHLRKSKAGNSPSVVFLDHTGNESFKGRSRINVMEAHIVASVVEDLLLTNKHLRGQDIGIIAPYAAQITLLTRLFNADANYKQRFKDVLGDHRAMQLEHIEIKTVDGFEGREKEVIIFSTVRNNSAGHIGFLADRRRLNVGLTRAKRGLFVVGSIQTLKACKMSSTQGEHAVVRIGKGAESWRRYAEYLVEKGCVVSLTGGKLSKALYGHLDAQQRLTTGERTSAATRMKT
ncbi:P-loop containing nucleoside triphosphate hydrolase protein [Crassisporium funariophilum]|nr:P-loop containing nucleoside triphosphate hydrolase protein [Crassisporium funariophilum]